MKKKISDLITNLLSKAMPKVIDITGVRGTGKRRILYNNVKTPWVGVPNIKYFQVDIGKLDVFFALFGIERKHRTKVEFITYKNRSINRYIEHQIIRLGKARDNGNSELYFHIADMIMKRSNSFRVLAINHVFPQWHRKLPLWAVLGFNRNMSKLINQHVNWLDYKRVYIPKGDKRFRPLGVPKPEWRLLLHQYSNFLTFWLMPKFTDLHGFVPSRGIVTAWREIMSLINKPYIYEWDFKSFFDKIYIRDISRELEKFKIPNHWIYFLENVNSTPIKLANEDLIDETANRRHTHLLNWAYKRWGKKKIEERKYKEPDWMQDIRDGMGPEMFKEWSKGYRPFNTGNLLWPIDPVAGRWYTAGFIGVPQGAATSPTLSNTFGRLWVNHGKKTDVKIIIYADDSVGFSDNEISLQVPKRLGGVEFEPNKCGYVKFAGKWLKPLKFLGLECDGDKFRANTRKGSTLELTGREILLGELFAELHDKCQELTVDGAIELLSNTIEEHKTYDVKESWEKIFQSRLSGWIVNRLQSGDWNITEWKQDFNLKFINSSWMSTKMNPGGLDIFNSSSFANLSLLNMLRWNQKLRKERKPRVLPVIRNVVGGKRVSAIGRYLTQTDV